MASHRIRRAWFSWPSRTKQALPNVVGLTEEAALIEIGRVQNPGTRTTGTHASIPAGSVISTNPAAGVKNYPDTVAVAYVVSTGTP
jgi:beta-lactam-binding protein with PASTA domain